MLKLIIAKVGSEEQLEKEAFRMAGEGEQGCSLASDPELQSQLRQLLEGVARGPGSVGAGAARSALRATAIPPSAAWYGGGRW